MFFQNLQQDATVVAYFPHREQLFPNVRKDVNHRLPIADFLNF